VLEPGSRIELVVGDLTRERADALVNAANPSLAGGGGVDGALHRAAGPELLAECRARYPGGCPAGEARITAAHALPARYVIHAVGPVWRGGGEREDELLASAYRAALELAAAHGCASVAFPAIACGAYGFPWERAARAALAATLAWLADHPLPGRVRFVLSGAPIAAAFRAAHAELAVRSAR
jgi:O-acetyl-ADP-ribose deacetylase (regulator of RNase III)